jgi:two-component system, NtrC family, response regulator AtoC
MKKPISLLIVDDEEPLRTRLGERFTRKGYSVSCAPNGTEALILAQDKRFHVALVDIKMPGMNGIELLRALKVQQPFVEVIILTGYAEVDTAIEAMKSGAYDYLAKPYNLNELEIIVQKAYEKSALQKENYILRDEVKARDPYGVMIGNSPRMIAIQNLIEKVAPTDSSVLIEGESGTGKELVANMIHRKSHRKEQPFIVIDCSILQENLLENELFGHEKGAFTGATAQKIGLVELADRGTAFVDEIAEMNLTTQAKFLRILETGSFRRVGGTKQLKVDVRVIAATKRILEHEVKEGEFREDLYYRLNVVKVHLPPLRERREEIPLLVNHFLKQGRAAQVIPKPISPEALEVLMAFDWPGNVRELANVIEQALILSSGPAILPEDLPFQAKGLSPSREINRLSDVEKEHIARALEKERGNKTKAAKTLGISLRNLYRKIEKHNLR